MRSWSTHVLWAGITLLAAALGRWSAPEPVAIARPSVTRTKEADSVPAPGVNRSAAAAEPRDAAEPPVVMIETRSGSPVPLEELRAGLKSDKAEDQQVAFNLIEEMPYGPLKRELLMEILQMKNGWYRRTALWELKRQMQDKAVGLVRDALASDPYPEVREAAALLLGEPGGEGNIDLLEKAYREDEYKVRLAAARSLNQLGRQGPMLELIPQLAAKLDSVDGGVRRNAVEQLGQFWSMSAVPYLTPALHDSNSDVRLAAVIALGNTGATGHPEVTALLEPLTKDPSKEVADWALDFLRRSKQ